MSAMMHRMKLAPPIERTFCALVGTALILLLSTMVVFAQEGRISAPEAAAKVNAGDMILLDIRSPEEWAETGVAKGAWPVTMHSPDFGTNLQAVLNRHPDTPIALICATGGRSNYVASVLKENGLSNVIDLSEGMFGNGQAPGWIARKMPVVDVATATAAHQKALLPSN